MALYTEFVKVPVSDETEMSMYLARPEGQGPWPGIILYQEIFGVNAHIREMAERLALQGYLVVAPDMFHRSAPGFESGYDDLQPGFQQAAALTPEGVIADIQAAYQWLNQLVLLKERLIGCVGFCLGGRLSFVSAAHLPVTCAVSYYGGGILESHVDLIPEVKAPLLFHWAGKDTYIPASSHVRLVELLREAGKSFVSTEYADVGHGFSCDARADYDATAAAQAWGLTLAFLRSHLYN